MEKLTDKEKANKLNREVEVLKRKNYILKRKLEIINEGTLYQKIKYFITGKAP